MKVSEIVDFLSYAGRLKGLKRTGWVLRGVPEPETVAEHTYRTALISYLLATLIGNVDREKVLRIALVHDLAEGLIGDLPLEAKRYAKIDEISAFNDIPGLPEEFLNDFKEFQERSTEEAMIVRAADKIDLLLQVLDYEKSLGTRLDEFWENMDNRVDFDFHPIIKEIVEEIERRRDA
ncbi:oxetanocin [bacterium]|nr:MAG: oxetanocin [bacterium]